jgi:predicted nucleotidyltransferase
LSLTAAVPADVMMERLGLPCTELEILCLANCIRHLAVFGSVVRDDFDPASSDVDVIARFEASSCPAYADRYFAIKEELERMIGRAVDLVTERSLTNPYLKRRIDAEKVMLFAA